MSPLFEIGEKRLAEIETRAANVLTFTRDTAVRQREAARLASWRRQALAVILNGDDAA